MKRITVTIVRALPDSATEIAVELPAGATVAEALARSGLGTLHPGPEVATMTVGIYGISVAPETVLADGDRVELYRPLLADPKDARRRRASRRTLI